MATHQATFDFQNGRSVSFKFTRPQTVERDSDRRVTFSTARLPAGLSEKEKAGILATIAEDWSTHCQHSYDCCGHWYRTCRAVITGRRITLYVGYRKNI